MDKACRVANPRQKDFFNSRASTWDETVVHDLTKVSAIVGRLGLRPGDRVLDVGTGTGVTIQFLDDMVGPTGRIVCVDYSEGMIRIAKEKHPRDRYPNVSFVTCDVNEHAMTGDLDAILCYSCFPHFIDQEGTVRHLASGLREGGRLMVAHSQSRSDINKVHLESGEVVENDHLPTMDELRGMMVAAGLRVRETTDSDQMFYIVSERP